LEFFYIYYINKNNENDTTHKSEINANMEFTQSLPATNKTISYQI